MKKGMQTSDKKSFTRCRDVESDTEIEPCFKTYFLFPYFFEQP